ncbi:zonular occludens toxin domain-containing protein [Xanthomonas campestris pv. asclepiadis]|uniref:zonular occludens toxin domain-containing protein n=1 Tax=Xanthomonas campestris TaxID=339 RepID=UPI001E3D8443|nr:zonular occludens toxin domain-containing protein [Xanthomonas campestris]MCC4615628.1 zonular occludens toxin domain-containing protein [Xanthomonas campestris pv. asclepiadis]
MSAIGQTASITLITGVPGNGKTLRAVWYMKSAIDSGVPVFACNVNGLQIDGVTDYPDPTKWEQLPAGSVLVVDEAQKFFRAGITEKDPRTDSDTFGKQVVPLNIQAMETIRHGGIRLILLTQSPLLIHANIRALVGLHEHMVRQGGKQLATVYRRSRVMDNVRSEKALLAEDHESWAYPRECYALYKSAEVHTVKHKLSSKAKRGIMLAIVAACLVGYAIWNGKNLMGGSEKEQAGTPGTGASATGPGVLGGDNNGQVKYAGKTDYAAKHLPRFDTMPWTAEVFDQRPVVADPQVFCMSSMPAASDPREASCTCMTEQGTRYELSQPMCRTLARNGAPYNPYKDVRQQQQQQQQAQTEQVAHQNQPLQLGGSVIARGTREVGSFPESKPYATATSVPSTTADL